MIHTLTLNPAMDKMLFLDRLQKNVTNRIGSIAYAVGGKGTHVSVNLAVLGERSRAYGLCYGETGAKILQLLGEYDIELCFVHGTGAESRTNYLLIEGTGDCTLIAQKGVPPPPEDVERLFSMMRGEVAPGDLLVISGDASNCGELPLRRVAGLLEEKQPLLLLDTSGESLRHCAQLSPFLIKPNLDELSALCGRPVAQDRDDIVGAIRSLEGLGIPVVAVTLGGRGAIVRTPQGLYCAGPPPVAAVNTIGCGDGFLAGFAYGWAHYRAFPEAIRLATAVAGAAAENRLSVGFDAQRARALLPAVEIETICVEKGGYPL